MIKKVFGAIVLLTVMFGGVAGGVLAVGFLTVEGEILEIDEDQIVLRVTQSDLEGTGKEERTITAEIDPILSGQADLADLRPGSVVSAQLDEEAKDRFILVSIEPLFELKRTISSW